MYIILTLLVHKREKGRSRFDTSVSNNGLFGTDSFLFLGSNYYEINIFP